PASLDLLEGCSPPTTNLTKGVESLTGTDWIHHSFSGSRILENVFHPSPPLRTLHTVTRIERTRRRPACGKDTMNVLGLEKAHAPPVHKNIPPGNAKLKAVEPSVTVKALRLSQGLPAEESGPYSNMTGILIKRGHLDVEACSEGERRVEMRAETG
uniref:Uncharacterized protein n=1 Tax=Ursus americanus TaxID=9643 RepID=A0A452RME7_URSAM